MNILMVADISFPDVKGGSGRFVKEMSKALMRKGHLVHVLTETRSAQLTREELSEDVTMHRYRVNASNVVLLLLTSLLNARRAFNRITKQIQFDVVIFHQPSSAMGVLLSSKIKQIQKLYTFHSSWPQEYEARSNRRGMGFSLRKYLEHNTLEKMKDIVVLSHFSKEKLLELYSEIPFNIYIVPGGVDTKKFTPSNNRDNVKRQLNIDTDKRMLFTLRGLNKRMGLENLIKAMAIVTTQYGDNILVIGGSGPLKEKLQQMVKTLKLEEYIIFTDIIDDAILPLYYQAADLFILPTKALEGFGLVTLEALSCGTPVLGTPVGATIEILKNLDPGLIFKGTDADSLAALISEYLAKPQGEIEGLRRKCRQFIEKNYSWDISASQYEAILKNITTK